MNILDRCTQALARAVPCPRGARVAVGVSGGADSTALIHLLARARGAFALDLVAVYVDHGLRPAAARKEAAHVGAMARDLGLPFALQQVDVPGAARGRSIEEAARDLRYAALAAVAGPGGLVAVGHTRDDQVETVLLKLLRGAGARGLSGMRVLDSRTGLLRPLLHLGREELRAWLADQGIAWIEDESNADPRFLRNRIRGQVLPHLRAILPDRVDAALLKSADILACEDHLLEGLAREARARVVTGMRQGELALLDRPALAALHPALGRRVVEGVLVDMGARPRHAHVLALVEAACGPARRGELHLAQGLRARLRPRRMVLAYPRGRGPWRG